MLVKPPKFIQRIFNSYVWRNENSQKKIWLTFDDGPDPITTPFILKTLEKENVRATFFLVGEQIEKNPQLLKDIIKNGHVIANHSYSHKNGWTTNKLNYVEDVEKCQKYMPKNILFRPPYGKITFSQSSVLKKKYKIILWDILSYDFSSKISPQKVKRNIINNTNAGSIIVLHNNKKSFNNLRIILLETIKDLKKKEFVFSTIW